MLLYNFKLSEILYLAVQQPLFESQNAWENPISISKIRNGMQRLQAFYQT